jgi:hypothetical protein
MSNATSFVNSYTDNIVKLIDVLEELRTQNDMLVQDPTLKTRYFETQTAPPFPAPPPTPPRSDITEEDITNAEAAIVQMLFTFDSGDPPQKSFLYKMTP